MTQTATPGEAPYRRRRHRHRHRHHFTNHRWAQLLGTWHPVAWFSSRFRSQFVNHKQATYQQLPNVCIEVLNQCRLAGGKIDQALSLARPASSKLQGQKLEQAQLEVSFLQRMWRCLPVWGSNWVLQLADESAIRSGLVQQGYGLVRWQRPSRRRGRAQALRSRTPAAGAMRGEDARYR